MPFMVKAPVNHDGRAFDMPDVVSDALGAAILEEHPHALVRIAFDPDLCANMIGAEPAPVVKVAAVVAPVSAVKE